jgi:hypothetical protein
VVVDPEVLAVDGAAGFGAGLLVFLVTKPSFFTWATASIIPLNKRALNRIRLISDAVPFSWECTTRAATAPRGLQVKLAMDRGAVVGPAKRSR